MKPPIFTGTRRTLIGITATLSMTLVGGCAALFPNEVIPPAVYVLDGSPALLEANAHAVVAAATAPALIVNPTRSAPGFDSQHIVYVRVAHQLEHFAHNEWADTPARMLTPLIVSAIERTGRFRAAGASTSGIAAELRLDTEVLRLQQDFGETPSRVSLTLRATLSDNTTRQVISWQTFDETVPAASDDPYGGVVAANVAVQQVMAQLARYCAGVAASHPRPAAP
ncbi:ABC-type transport auxiliary lipoprotein family protein [Variovorax sp. H27-G14]|uniref:ABC-type transport auxiliary lipoprotein family protein n=1 Tax=Variovorax sp. H27-G14 TaxID=3111914 RepID=UPI0038FC725A